MEISRWLAIVLCGLAALLPSPVGSTEQQQHEYCVIGAGPSGGHGLLCVQAQVATGSRLSATSWLRAHVGKNAPSYSYELVFSLSSAYFLPHLKYETLDLEPSLGSGPVSSVCVHYQCLPFVCWSYSAWWWKIRVTHSVCFTAKYGSASFCVSVMPAPFVVDLYS